MADAEPSEKTFIHKAANWLGGITALILAIAGLKAAFNEFLPAPPPPPPDVAPAAVSYPTKYRKPNGFLEKNSNGWLETDALTGAAIPWSEVRREEDYTVLWDESRQMYLRFPNDGGQVQWSFVNPIVWTDLYFAQADKKN